MNITLHKFQEKAFLSDKQIVINAAGIQSGKTLTGALWIHLRAMSCGPGDNLIIAAPTYKILSQASMPHFLSFAKSYGVFHKVDSIFKYKHGPIIYIRSLSDPNAMEGVTNVEGLWLDEGGLISRYAWENCIGRCAFRQAKVMVTTTPYSLNWLYSLWKECRAGERDSDVEFLQYSSIDNPYFPKAEFERQKKILDSVRFAMKYMAQFGKMEGLVYPDVFFCDAIPMPPGTRYFAGVDWGYTNPFALVVRAVTPEGLHYRVDEYMKSGMDIDECVHVAKVKAGLYPIENFICDPSAPMNLMKFNKAGLKAIKANNDIIHGIDVHRQLMKTNRFSVFNECKYAVDEYNSYHYPEPKDLGLNDDQKEQVPVAQNDHSMDADRYVTVYLESALADKRPITSHNPGVMPQDALKRLQWLKKGGSTRAKNY